ncbi:MAG: acylphosphatase [Acidobacteriaceae bacterium]|jgi:acylphosphatase|nr:acylphosphatase [Acidobacteriaceae bacterium]
MQLGRRYLVTGHVQGVGFRWFVEAAASRENLHGWVRNLSDGSVELIAEGEREALERFERALWHGPSRARVEHVDITDVGPSGHGAGFTIR